MVKSLTFWVFWESNSQAETTLKAAEFTSNHLLDTHASRLRIKILNAGGPRAISAVRSVGYRLI